ncbi:MAG: DegV family protein [Firmicutes bacterium]|nr:DegV family protein [Bacillota bacterium]MCL2770891.1 DegV family protein [Bacillota bacterium]
MKIKFTMGIAGDLSPELLKKYNISTTTMPVLLGEEEFFDGKNLTPADIYAFVKKTKILPKTAAPNEFYFEEFFTEHLKGFDALVHVEISAGISLTYENAVKAAEKFKNVYVVDSKSLSTGTGLVAIKATQLNDGKRTAKEIAEELRTVWVPKSQASFILDNLEYMKKGGRCSMVQLLGANLLKIKPKLTMNKEGKLIKEKTYKGRLDNVLVEQYVPDLLKDEPAIKDYCFITYTTMEKETIKALKDKLTAEGFKDIMVTTAGCVITSHCGEGTLGVLYFRA